MSQQQETEQSFSERLRQVCARAGYESRRAHMELVGGTLASWQDGSQTVRDGSVQLATFILQGMTAKDFHEAFAAQHEGQKSWMELPQTHRDNMEAFEFAVVSIASFFGWTCEGAQQVMASHAGEKGDLES